MSKRLLLNLFATALLICSSWASIQAQTFTVTAPESVAGEYGLSTAEFGPPYTGFSGMIVPAVDTSGATTNCFELANADEVAGNIALIDRGVCAFTQKALNAQAAGAIGVIICNNDMANPDTTIVLGGGGCDVTIPTIMLSFNTCQTLRTEMGVTADYVAPETPSDGNAFETAIEITDGTYTVDSIIGTNGLFSGSVGAKFYQYTAAEDGVLNVSSCGGGADTRIILIAGECASEAAANLIGFSIDDCDDGNGNIVASNLNTLVTAGSTYYIVWDDAQSADGFDFTVTLNPLPTVAITFQVDLSFEGAADTVNMVYAGPSASSIEDVGIAGMTDEDGDGIYTATVEFTSLDTIGYAFVNGSIDPANVESVPGGEEGCGIDGGFGFNIRPLIITVIGDATVPVVCFSSCGTCEVTDCAEPRVLLEDDYESYPVGEEPVADYIQPWAAGVGLGTISTDQAVSGEQSYLITGDGSDVDPILLLGDQTEGHYIVSWEMYIPEGNGAFYNIQHFEESGIEWAFQLTIETDGVATLDAGEAARVTFDFPRDGWVTMAHYIDLDNDVIRLYVDGDFISSWPFNWQTFETSGTKQLGAINFYPRSTDDVIYIDDFYYAQIPAAGDGQYCYTAAEIEPGVHTVADLECFGSGFFSFDGGAGDAGAWFEYTAEADGFISVGSCNQGVDTRVLVFQGDCGTLELVGANDDECDTGGGNAWASYREVPVQEGETYFIVWDNIWESTGFDFELTFTEGELPAGDFCESAVAIEPGTVTIDTIDGNAVVGGPSFGSFSSANTFYYVSEWYSFTPTEDGTMSVYSCVAPSDDTKVFVYEGECGIPNIELVASDEDGDAACAPDGGTRMISVEAGQTYYIEWYVRSATQRSGFDFILEFGAPTVEVTFQVDAAVLEADGELAEDGMFIAGEFNTWTGEAMADDDEDGVWTLTVPVAVGDTVEYKFQNGEGNFEDVDTSIGDDCTLGGFGNRFVIVGETGETLDAVCYGFCVSCAAVDVKDPVFNGSLSIAPNPAQDVTTIQFNFEEATDISIRLTSSLGQMILERQIDGALSGNEELDVASLAAGMYFLHITDGVRSKTEPLVIQR